MIEADSLNVIQVVDPGLTQRPSGWCADVRERTSGFHGSQNTCRVDRP
jgi:hypothetical protein